MSTSEHQFTTDVTDLPPVRTTEVVDLGDGGRYELKIAPVAKRMGGDTVRMLAYNGSIPGPILRVRQGAQVAVDIENQGDMEGTVHWHGLRLDNRYDGTHQTQAPIQVGGRFTAVIKCPDPGAYWYHPHIRSDYGIEMGLYGGVVVDPDDPDYWPPVHRELFVTLDDLLLEEGKVAPFSREETTHAAMGRFGNVILVNGETDLALTAQRGEVLRLYLLNTANTRVFNVALPGVPIKLVGGDSGHVEQEEWVEEVVLAPSERVVVDVLFEAAGEFEMQHRTPDRVYPLAVVTVQPEPAEPSLAESYPQLRSYPDMVAERARIQPYLAAAPDKTLSFLAEMNLPQPEGNDPVVYACPMHPDVVSETPAHCPQCGMKLVAVAAVSMFVCPMHPEVVSDEPGHCPRCAMKLLPKQLVDQAAGHEHAGHGHEHPGHGDGHGDAHSHGTSEGIEWEDDMVEVNRMTTPANFQWKLVDQDTEAVNAAIDWRFRVGDQVKIRLVNEMAGDHPMHHPFHIHGAGRFLVLSRDGVVEPNLVWKDTVLLRTGETVDILLDVTEPGTWMAHCHIAEHHETGMMFNFEVAKPDPSPPS
ncbi:MAG: putative Multicopper oxidase [Nocardioides sp.]|nr:putative Multicopper oxidase [Nocardioides sp.]